MLTLYAVKNQEGKWFRRKGQHGWGETWVEDFARARIYSKIGQARSIVTFFAGKWPQYGVPSLVALEIGNERVIQESDRVQKSIIGKKAKLHRQEIRRKEWERERLTKAIEESRAALDKLK